MVEKYPFLNKFEKVKRFENDDTIHLPERKTAHSAGYDFEVAEDIVVPSWLAHSDTIRTHMYDSLGQCLYDSENSYMEACVKLENSIWSLSDVAKLTKDLKAKPTLVPTGIKASLNAGYFLQLSVRSSCPLKYWLMLANGVGVIDADYYGNPDNDGEIFFQIINMFPYDIELKKGDIIGQGIILPYYITDNDTADGVRTGGFGSTS